MLPRWSIRRRLTVIVLVVSAVIIGVTVATAQIGATGSVEVWAQQALIAGSRAAASALDARLNAEAARLKALADILALRNLPPQSALLRPSSAFMSEADALVERVGVLRPFGSGYQMIAFRSDVTNPNRAVIEQQFFPTLPNDLAFLFDLPTSAVHWLDDVRSLRAGEPFDGVIAAARYLAAADQPFGAVWFEIPRRKIMPLLANIERTETERLYSYDILLDSSGSPLVAAGAAQAFASHSRTTPPLTLSDPQLYPILDMITAAHGEVTLVEASPTHNRHAALAVAVPLQNGWSLVRFLLEDTLGSELTQNALAALLLATIGIILLGLAVDRIILVGASRPLTELSRAAREIGSGDMRYYVSYQDQTDEIGDLAQALDTMRTNLAESYDALTAWNRVLERRVSERTHDLNKAVQRAENANLVKTHFLASVTHELRTPLNLVINNLDFMRAGAFGAVNDEQQVKLEQAIRSAEHLLYMINDLLDVSKIEAGELRLFKQETDLTPLIEDALDAANPFLSAKPNVRLHVEIDDPLPRLTIDGRRIRQVLHNLLGNAVKFTPSGNVWLRVRDGETAVEFEVSDTGIGIPPEELDSIFTAFERSSSARQRNIEGTGLGLAISRHIVQAHGSDLVVTSEVGRGSQFVFNLPKSQPD